MIDGWVKVRQERAVQGLDRPGRRERVEVGSREAEEEREVVAEVSCRLRKGSGMARAACVREQAVVRCGEGCRAGRLALEEQGAHLEREAEEERRLVVLQQKRKEWYENGGAEQKRRYYLERVVGRSGGDEPRSRPASDEGR